MLAAEFYDQLREAHKKGNINLQTLLQKQPWLVNWHDEQGNTVLHVALNELHQHLSNRQNGHIHLGSGRRKSLTAQQQKELNAHIAVANQFMRHGANIFVTNNLGKTPYSFMHKVAAINFGDGEKPKFDFFQTGVQSSKSYIEQFLLVYNQQASKDKALTVLDLTSLSRFAKCEFTRIHFTDNRYTPAFFKVLEVPIYRPIGLPASSPMLSRLDLMRNNGHVQAIKRVVAQYNSEHPASTSVLTFSLAREGKKQLVHLQSDMLVRAIGKIPSEPDADSLTSIVQALAFLLRKDSLERRLMLENGSSFKLFAPSDAYTKVKQALEALGVKVPDNGFDSSAVTELNIALPAEGISPAAQIALDDLCAFAGMPSGQFHALPKLAS